MTVVQIVTCRRRHVFHLVVLDPTAFVSETLRHVYSVCPVLCCPSSALLDDDTVLGLDCCSLTLGETCVVTCSDAYTAAKDADEHVTGGFSSFTPMGVG